MVFKKFQTQVLIRILLILINCVWLSIEIGHAPNVYTLIFLSSLLALQTWMLIRYVNRSNRELSRVFASLWDQDTSFSLAPSDPSGSFSEIAKVINESRQQIQKARIDREKHYRYLQFIINHMDIGLLSFHNDGSVEHFNHAAGKLLGREKQSPMESLNVLQEGLAKTLMEMEPGQSKIVNLFTGGDRSQLLIRMTQLNYEDHPLKLISLQDVRTELDEQELIAWKRLIRVLNHEVMNSLTPIRTLSHAIDRSLDELNPADTDRQIIEDVRKNSRLIANRSASMADFVNRYREITSIQKISRGKFGLGVMLQEVKALYQKELSDRGISCSLEIDPPRLEMEGDENMLKQVVINLVKNSLDALRNLKEGSILISAKKSDTQLTVAVMDNGPGIPPEYMEDIFTPFFSTREDGSGIGLSFSKQIVRLHGGNISIQSESGKGTIVSLKFSD
jgi:nitrogen fixation/metabolism regulation signal transduction histidine kinase